MKGKGPLVCLVGRTNVGKSALFNRLTGRRTASIVLDRVHVTRDYVQDVVRWKGKSFRLADTGGFTHTTPKDEITREVKKRALELLQEAHVVLFVCDIQVGLTEEDLGLARIVHRLGKPVFLLLNKADNKKMEDLAIDFRKLDFEQTFCTSVVHSRGIHEVLDFLIDRVPVLAESEQAAPDLKVAVIGKPNVGKSSLVNLLAQSQRCIVSPEAGTTREAIPVWVNFNRNTFEITDTAGIRQPRGIHDDLEKMMVKTSLEAIRTASIVLLLIDGSTESLTQQELRLMQYASEQKKPLILIINKVDLMDEFAKTKLTFELQRYDFLLKKFPILKLSCMSRKGVTKIVATIEQLWKRCINPLDSVEVTALVRSTLASIPMYRCGHKLNIWKVVVMPAKVPTFHLYVNNIHFFKPSHLAYVENLLRKHFDLYGCPVVLEAKQAVGMM